MCRYPENLSKILQGKIHMQYIAALLDMSVTTYLNKLISSHMNNKSCVQGYKKYDYEQWPT